MDLLSCVKRPSGRMVGTLGITVSAITDYLSPMMSFYYSFLTNSSLGKTWGGEPVWLKTSLVGLIPTNRLSRPGRQCRRNHIPTQFQLMSLKISYSPTVESARVRLQLGLERFATLGVEASGSFITSNGALTQRGNRASSAELV